MVFTSGAKKESARFQCGFISRLRSRSPLRDCGTCGVSRMAAKWKALPITTEPNERVEPVHNRMPVILLPEDEEQWLDTSRTAFVKARSLLKPFPEELMDAHDVLTIVNSAKYDGPECIRPVSDDERPSTPQLSLL